MILCNYQKIHTKHLHPSRIYVASPTRKIGSKWDLLNSKDVTIVNKALLKLLNKKYKNRIYDVNYKTVYNYNIEYEEKPDINLLERIMKEQEQIIKNYGKDIADNVLIIYDDCAALKRFFNSEVFVEMLFNSRHYKISTIITSQSYFKIPKPIRENASGLLLFNTGNKKELKLIYEENNGDLSDDEFLQMFKDVCVDYNFLYINYQNDSKHRYENCFEEFI